MSEINSNFSKMSATQWISTLKEIDSKISSKHHDKTHQISLKTIELVSQFYAKDSSCDLKEMVSLISSIARSSSDRRYKGIHKITKFFISLFHFVQGKGFKTTEDRLLDLAQKLTEQPQKKALNPATIPPLTQTPKLPSFLTLYKKGEVRTADLIPTAKSLIGKGTRGKVHLHRHDHNLVVKKTREDLKKEFSLGYQLNHPCIAKSKKLFIKHYRHGSPKYKMIMERIEGVSVSQHQKLPPSQITSLFQEAQKTMIYLFEQSVFWGDVSENNIFITNDGHLKICDLGYWKKEKNTSLLTKNLLLGAMELSRWILTASQSLENLSTKDQVQWLARIFKPQEFFGDQIPPQNKILSLGAFSDVYRDELWMKSLMAKINQLQPDGQIQFLQKYMDCVITNFNQWANPSDAQT